MEPGARLAFKSNRQQGAVLVTKHITHKEDTKKRLTFVKYIKWHYTRFLGHDSYAVRSAKNLLRSQNILTHAWVSVLDCSTPREHDMKAFIDDRGKQATEKPESEQCKSRVGKNHQKGTVDILFRYASLRASSSRTIHIDLRAPYTDARSR